MPPQHKKSENMAFFLSFILPGAGLLYLGRRLWAVANFCIVLLIGVILVFSLPGEVFDAYIRYIAMGIAGGCGGLAMALAKQMNESNKD
jgi:TM2 domain-containing membrane protein YozV